VFDHEDSLRSRDFIDFVAHSHTPRNSCVRFVFGVTAASRNTRFQAARYGLTLVGFALRNGEGFADIVETTYPCASSSSRTKLILAYGPCSGCDRIKPTQTAKPRKITVRGAKRKPVFHSQRSQISIRDEIAVHARQREKFTEQFGVPFRRLRYPCRLAREPCIYLPPRIANRFGMFEYARISHQPPESERAGPRQTDRTGTVQLLIEPVARYGVLSKRAHNDGRVASGAACARHRG
jgi:hypothetical protein